MVLKGIVFGLFLLLFHQMVLKGTAIVTYGLQMSSILSVDFAIGDLDHVGTSTIQDFSHCASHPFQGACPLFIGEELDLLLNLEGAKIFGSVGFVEVFFLLFLNLDEFLLNLMYVDRFGWS